METLCELFDEIVISVDGDRATHDARRSQGRYDLTVANMETACKLGAAYKLSITATPEKTLQKNRRQWRISSCSLGRNLYIEPDGSVHPCDAYWSHR